MGTSSRHPGSNDKSPLVPPHADAEPEKPIPEALPKRFQQFRRKMGEFVKSGDSTSLNSGLRHYVNKATGGPAVGPRKFGSAYSAGGQLISALSALGGGQAIQVSEYETSVDIDLNSCIGKSIDEAIQILGDGLSPNGEESDKVRTAIVEALSESLEDCEVFDVSILNEDIYTSTIIHFLSEILFIDICIESGDAFGKATDSETLQAREISLREIIFSSVDKHLSPYLTDGISKLSRDQLKTIQLNAMKEVFLEWGDFE